jgi:hypothetical protein
MSLPLGECKVNKHSQEIKESREVCFVQQVKKTLGITLKAVFSSKQRKQGVLLRNVFI